MIHQKGVFRFPPVGFGHAKLTILVYISLKGTRVALEGVANGKCETLRDGETSAFLCEPETF